MKKNAKISLIFPVYDESLVFDDIRKLEVEFKKRNLKWEAVCVFDLSLEKSTSKLKLPRLTHVKALFYPLERFGKGFALCYAFNQSTGDLVFFWEGNFSVSAKQLLLYVDLMDLVEADIVVGSKRHPLSSVYYPPFRRFCLQIYQLLVKILFGLNISDTQVGLKLYKRQVLNRVIPKIIIKNWAFDLEILVVAHNLDFKRVIEAPIELKGHFFAGKKLTFSNIYHLLGDTLAIFYRKHLIRYYQQKFV